MVRQRRRAASRKDRRVAIRGSRRRLIGVIAGGLLAGLAGWYALSGRARSPQTPTIINRNHEYPANERRFTTPRQSITQPLSSSTKTEKRIAALEDVRKKPLFRQLTGWHYAKKLEWAPGLEIPFMQTLRRIQSNAAQTPFASVVFEVQSIDSNSKRYILGLVKEIQSQQRLALSIIPYGQRNILDGNNWTNVEASLYSSIASRLADIRWGAGGMRQVRGPSNEALLIRPIAVFSAE